MSVEHPSLSGRVSGKEKDCSYGFVNNPVAINGYSGPIPETVFIHAKALKGEPLVDGMSISFDARPSSRDKHEGKLEAHNVNVLHESRSKA